MNARRITAAGWALRRAFGRGLVVSRHWRSPAWPPGSGADFVNAVAMLPRMLPPEAVLARLHRIEAQMGRVRAGRWGTRVLDLDLIAVGPRVRPDVATLRRWMALPPARQAREAPDRLLLPHPRMQDRAFVLLPMAELAPRWRHPVTGRSVAGMVRALPMAKRLHAAPLPRAGPTPCGRKAGNRSLVKR